MRSAVSAFPALSATVLAGLLVLAWPAGCTTVGTIGPPAADGTDDAGGGGSDDLEAGEQEVLVRFINLSDVVVDPEFYATNEPLEDPRNELFVPAYRIQTGIGLAATSRLGPGDFDEITYPCTDTTVMGTAGGKYLDINLGTTLGTGQVRWLVVEVNFDCGNRIIFTYRGEDGDYSTEPPLVDFTD
jgi:hypothetical protein